MAEQRKVFRIEETAADLQSDDPQALRHAGLMQELRTLRTMLAAGAPQPAPAESLRHATTERLISELHTIQSRLGGTPPHPAGREAWQTPAAAARIADELEAVMKGSEQATERILAAAEDIDQTANNLSAVLKDRAEQELAHDIRDRVIQIFEACNFQDLTSQRVAKVMATLRRIDEQISIALNGFARADAAPAASGPRLESDHGHASQSEIDTLFGDGGPAE
jgi:chemotaxis protein CheZ